MSHDRPRLAAALAGRYRIEGELGRGGMATVYLAHDLKHDRPVAVKVLRPEIAAALGAERFLQEILISARLDHPHILTLIDSGNALLDVPRTRLGRSTTAAQGVPPLLRRSGHPLLDLHTLAGSERAPRGGFLMADVKRSTPACWRASPCSGRRSTAAAPIGATR